MSKSVSNYALALLVLAFLVRLLWILGGVPYLESSIYSSLDGDNYLKFAQKFHTGIYLDEPETWRMPFYPGLIAYLLLPVTTFTSASFSGTPESLIRIIQFWNIGLDMVVLASVYLWVRMIANEKAALFSGLLFTFYPLSLYRLPMVNTEMLQSAVLALWVLGAVVVLKHQRLLHAVLLSALSAFFAFISPATQFLIVGYVGLLCIRFCFDQTTTLKSLVKLCACLMIPMVVLSAGWGLRNLAVTGDFFLFDVRGGMAFWMGNYQPAEGRWEGEKKDLWENQLETLYDEFEQQGGGSDGERNAFMFRHGINEITSNPSGALVLFGKKFVRFWFVPASERFLLVVVPMQLLFLFAALIGLAVLGFRSIHVQIILLVIAYFCAVYTVTYSCIRFSHPVMPWICALGGIGIHAIIKMMRGTGCGKEHEKP